VALVSTSSYGDKNVANELAFLTIYI